MHVEYSHSSSMYEIQPWDLHLSQHLYLLTCTIICHQYGYLDIIVWDPASFLPSSNNMQKNQPFSLMTLIAFPALFAHIVRHPVWANQIQPLRTTNILYSFGHTCSDVKRDTNQAKLNCDAVLEKAERLCVLVTYHLGGR